MKTFQNVPFLDSYRGRYLLLTLLVLLAIALLAFNNWRELKQASQVTSEHIIDRNKNQQVLHAIIQQFQIIKVQIYKFSLDPETTRPTDLTRQLTHLLELTERLDITLFDDVNAEMLNNFIVQIPYQFHDRSSDLIELRRTPESWVPVSKVVSQQLRPAAQQVMNLFEDILEDPDVARVDDGLIANEVLALKLQWIKLAGRFYPRMLNRFGVLTSYDSPNFDSPSVERELITHFRGQLDKLRQLPELGDYGFIREVLLEEMTRAVDQWASYQMEVFDLLMQPDWRRDLPALRELEDLLNQFNQTIVSLSDELSHQSNKDIAKLDQINRQTSSLFIFLCILALAFAISTYVIVDRNILRPVDKTTQALVMQARGESQELNVSYQTSETRALVDAFNQMSEKIRQRESRLDYIAHHDALTNLPNRLLFNERLVHAIALTERSRKKVALMILDLDRFKLINDTLGHLFGDKLLIETAGRLQQCVRYEDTIARLGGDEFAIILEQLESKAEVESIARKIIRLFEQPFTIDHHEIHASTSIGMAVAPLHSRDATTLIRYADIAMYQSKSSGRNQYNWFKDDMVDAEESMINFENQLREAITQNQFELYYQPQIDTRKPDSIAFESLIRWRHPLRGMLSPDQFIPVVDNRDLLCDMTCWVIRQAQAFQTRIKRRFGVQAKVSINLHAVIFSQQHFRERISAHLGEVVEDPRSFVLEITEDSLITDMKHASETLEYLHQLGFVIALDDFGTGQSSLSHLRSFPIDIIKIDREFIHGIHSDGNDANLVAAIIGLGQDLNMEVIAEGVEHAEQIEFLAERGCHVIQGHYFARAMPASAYLDFVAQQLARSG